MLRFLGKKVQALLVVLLASIAAYFAVWYLQTKNHGVIATNDVSHKVQENRPIDAIAEKVDTTIVINEVFSSVVTQTVTLTKTIEFVDQNFYSNKKWMFNSNCMQYSAYILKYGNDTWIEAIVNIYNKFYPKTYLADFMAVLKIMSTGEIIEVEPTREIGAYNDQIKKFYIRHDVITLNEENIGVALVRKEDFSKKLKTKTGQNNKTNVFPFNLINFQIPDVLVVDRKPAVALCINYVYKLMPYITVFLDMQKQFGIDKIQMYDAEDDFKTAKFIKNLGQRYDFVDVQEYNLDHNYMCGFIQNKTFPNEKVKKSYEDACLDFAQNDMNVKHLRRHEDASNNDCYIKMSVKYEFVGLYDVDELVFPRTINQRLMYEKRYFERFYCQDKQVCDLHPFSFNIYEYVNQIIRLNYVGDLDRLNGVSFRHVAYLSPDLHKTVIEQARRLVDEYSRNQLTSFPVYITMDKHHLEILNKDDMDYVKYLVNFQERVQCLDTHLDSSYTNDTKKYFRYLYHLTAPNQRFSKSIHYSKNTDMIFVHWGQSSKPSTNGLEAINVHGEFLSHFRGTYVGDMYSYNQTTSIRNVNIDIEYISYLLKQFTNFCNSAV